MAQSNPEPTPAAPAEPKATRRKKIMPKETTTPAEARALDRISAACETARTKLREASAALSDVTASVKDALREDRQRRSEIESVRAGLQKLQSIKV